MGRVSTIFTPHRKYVETAIRVLSILIDNASISIEKSKATKAVTKYPKQLSEMKINDEAMPMIANKRIEIDLADGVKSKIREIPKERKLLRGKKSLKVDLLAT